MMKKLKATLITLTVVLAIGLGAVMGGFVWYRYNHVKVNGKVYDLRAAEIDLRGQETSAEEYEALRAAVPGAEIRWDIPFQGARYADDTQELTVKELSDEDLKLLEYFTQLAHLDASECENYEVLQTFQQENPDCQVDYFIHVGQQKLPLTAESLVVNGDETTAEQLQAALFHLPALQSVELNNPSVPAADILSLQEQYGNVTFSWNKEVMGQVYPMDQDVIDISGTSPSDLQAVADTMAYFPKLTKLVMDRCGFENEDMAAFRDQVREQYKVVWGVQVGEAYLMTDETKFMPGQANKRVRDDDMYNLRYCEDMIAVDVGHLNISNLEWVVGTPHLKYLIVGDANVFDENLKPISCLKELEWLELFNTPVRDVSPLVGCTGLRDVLLSKSYIDVEPLGQMPWLENIWLLSSGINGQDITYLHEHLPNTHLEVAETNHPHSHGWRNLPRYFEMRDALGMWYMGG